MEIAIHKKLHLRKSFKKFSNKKNLLGLEKCSIVKKRVIKQFDTILSNCKHVSLSYAMSILSWFKTSYHA
jgi:hypothetical protein